MGKLEEMERRIEELEKRMGKPVADYWYPWYPWYPSPPLPQAPHYPIITWKDTTTSTDVTWGDSSDATTTYELTWVKREADE